jgi:hypothetical protein
MCHDHTNVTPNAKWPCHVSFDNPIAYISGPKREALHLSIKSHILGNLHSFNFFVQWANQIGSLQYIYIYIYIFVKYPQFYLRALIVISNN